MNNPFNNYSFYYDLIYEAKNYKSECDSIENILREIGLFTRTSLLDLGCGTGSHSIIFAKRGWKVTGVDRSTEMITIANEKAKNENLDIEFRIADITDFKSNKVYDVAVAMFAVVSYLTENIQVMRLLRNVSEMLNKEGLFIFDVWFGPAVLKLRPSDRYKIINKGEQQIIRFAQPELNINQNTVAVNYKILEIQDKTVLNEVDELHLMRYFFTKEIELFLEVNGFKCLSVSSTQDINRIPTENDWNITIIAKKNYPIF